MWYILCLCYIVVTIVFHNVRTHGMLTFTQQLAFILLAFSWPTGFLLCMDMHVTMLRVCRAKVPAPATTTSPGQSLNVIPVHNLKIKALSVGEQVNFWYGQPVGKPSLFPSQWSSWAPAALTSTYCMYSAKPAPTNLHYLCMPRILLWQASTLTNDLVPQLLPCHQK